MKNKLLILCVIAAVTLYGCSSESKSGPLGSAHKHADIKVYVLGNPIDYSVPKYQLHDEKAHFEAGDGDVAHTHATGITLGYLFESVGMKLDQECLTLDTGNKYCNLEKATLKVYVKSRGREWEQIFYHADYVIEDLDKILVTYGTEDEEAIKKQMDLATDKAGNY